MVEHNVYVLFLTWMRLGEDYMMWSVDYKSPDVSLHKTFQLALSELMILFCVVTMDSYIHMF